MADILPTSVDQPPNVLLTAIAKAAALIAAEEAGRRERAALDRDAVEEIVEEAIREAFKRIGVDLDDHKSIAAFNATTIHAERLRGLWNTAGATTFALIITTLVGGLITAVVTLVMQGGAK